MEEEHQRRRLRPAWCVVCICISVAGVIAVTMSFVEQPKPWKFWISGSVMSALLGYLGFTGKVPKWLQDAKRR